jgi:hypothetical protein
MKTRSMGAQRIRGDRRFCAFLRHELKELVHEKGIDTTKMPTVEGEPFPTLAYGSLLTSLFFQPKDLNHPTLNPNVSRLWDLFIQFAEKLDAVESLSSITFQMNLPRDIST